jgi:hypothetical protein
MTVKYPDTNSESWSVTGIIPFLIEKWKVKVVVVRRDILVV